MKATYFTLAALFAATGLAGAVSISLNFSQNDGNQSWQDPSSPVGPIGSPSEYFNTSNNPTGGSASLPVRTGDLNAGSLAGLFDSAGSPTSSSVTWNSKNTWYSASGTGSNEALLSVGYLDDGDSGGGQGVQIDFSDVPYDLYNVYIILASDQGGGLYTSQDFIVNGNSVVGGNFDAFGNWSADSANGVWTEANLSTRGNYIVARNQSGAALSIDGAIRDGVNRASVAGVVIEQVPEPSAAFLASFAGCLLLLRRRK